MKRKRILFLGDSITQGACASSDENNYVSKVGKMLDLDTKNYGIGGTRIAKQSMVDDYSEYFLFRAKKMESEADFVFIFGGTNDYGHGDAKIGKIDDKNDLTFYGALNNLLEYLIQKYGKEKLCFILPLHRYNENNLFGDGEKKQASLTLSGYVDIIKERVTNYGIDIIDLSKEFPIPKTNKGDELTADGLHPNDIGHQIIANKVCEYLQKKGIE